MKRQHPLLSSFGFILTAVMITGLALAVWRSGGMAFSPGRLSAKALPGMEIKGFRSHADFEGQCNLCHAPLHTTQDVLCLDCHHRVAQQIGDRNGTHGIIKAVNHCATCHSEHQGRDFDPVLGSYASFDHNVTTFSLVWHQVNYSATYMECAACHNSGPDFSTSDGKCAACHAAHDQEFMVQHVRDDGEACLACHDGHDRMIGFDHTQTAFPLEGQHAGLSCTRCHETADKIAGSTTGQQLVRSVNFKDTPKDCVQCHAEPEVHRGLFDQNCSKCHTSVAWSPAIWDGEPFDHAANTGFSLAHHSQNYNGQSLSCRDCHHADVRQFKVQTCYDCHWKDDQKPDFMNQHVERFGSTCLDCHDGVDRMKNFDHASFFPLDGAHAPLACEACHVDKVFKGTPDECSKCHAEPAIHAGFFGLQCQACHTSQAWRPARLRLHAFPLDHGGQGELACKKCHTGSYIEYTCYGCHDHQPDEIRESHMKAGVSLDELPNCIKCHPDGLSKLP